jgi:hypothetical protein
MIDEKFVIIGAILSFIGSMSYLIDTLKGITKPNKISWFFWALAPLIAFSAEIKQGVGWASLMTFVVGFFPLLVLISSFFNKNAYWKITKFDLFCGALSLSGLIFWQITRVGNIAILFSIVADGLACIPTIAKAWTNPETENWKVFLFSGINATITLMTLKYWNFQHSAFPIYILLADVILFAEIYWKIGKKFAK